MNETLSYNVQASENYDQLTTEGGNFMIILTSSGNNSVVECNLAKVEVAGSNPVSRSIFPLGLNSLLWEERQQSGGIRPH